METRGTVVEQRLNRQFYDLHNSSARFRVHQGGTRSGKTWACCQFLVYTIMNSETPLVISIIRKTLPALKGSVQRDFLEICKQTGIYWEGVHNKTENTFEYNGHLVEMLSIDDSQKIRGRKRNIAYLNEANELSFEDFNQINFRTTGFVMMDFNPSDPVHWIYDEIIPLATCDTWITTFKDNKFLGEDIIREIERIKDRDPDYWRVYGQGLKASYSKRQIFSNWQFIPRNEFPESDNVYVSVDFGFTNDACAIIEAFRVNDKIYVHELCYKTGMTNGDIADFLKSKGHGETLTFYDSAEPKSGEELRRAGILAKPAIKGQGSINAGISLIKEFDIIVSQESKNFQKEYENYYWEQLKDGTIINKPVDKFNHLMDALRYLVYTAYSKRNEFFVI